MANHQQECLAFCSENALYGGDLTALLYCDPLTVRFMGSYGVSQRGQQHHRWENDDLRDRMRKQLETRRCKSQPQNHLTKFSCIFRPVKAGTHVRCVGGDGLHFRHVLGWGGFVLFK